MKYIFKLQTFCICLICMCRFTGALHLKGTWRTSDFFLFLAKFGFQKTDPGLLSDTQGFVYGNITAKDKKNNNYFTLVLVDSDYFLEFYGNLTLYGAENCEKMFHKIDTMAFDYPCHADPAHGEDFLRKVPCPVGKLCKDEDNPANVLPGYQFTYKVQNSVQPRFWYLSLVACQRPSKTCKWTEIRTLNIEVDYDIWLVNGDPASKHLNPFEHQFSFEMHDVFEIYAIFFVVYIPTLIVWLYAYLKQVHRITKMLTACIVTEFTGIVFNFLHVFIFSFNGIGASWLKVLGNFLGIFAECLFMLLLLVVAKGWTITTMKLSSKKQIFCFWGIYTLLNAVFFIMSLIKMDIITNVDEWNSWPGYLIVGFRVIIMVWFFLELRATIRHGQHSPRLDFFHQFAAFYLVWLLYLPVLVLIADQISYLWRYKTILSLIDMEEETVFETPPTSVYREPHRLIKQETRLPVIHETSLGTTKMKARRISGDSLPKTRGSKTNLLESESSESSPSHDNYKANGTVYTDQENR
ncbi:TM145-like protein [Mya arenaria]|uniref:TM145-like protein n=1 Tax=Mya arenaria TaxID=6604 RepID=A0ABY7FFQ0_MYAAR|nr:TM145-like protein [Mya arenaria]